MRTFARKKLPTRSGGLQIEAKHPRWVIEYRRCRRLMLNVPDYIAV